MIPTEAKNVSNLLLILTGGALAHELGHNLWLGHSATGTSYHKPSLKNQPLFRKWPENSSQFALDQNNDGILDDEYGDASSIMSSGRSIDRTLGMSWGNIKNMLFLTNDKKINRFIFAAAVHKVMLGWIPLSKMRTVTADSATYLLSSSEVHVHIMSVPIKSCFVSGVTGEHL
jgi:hypothetical protein